MLKNLLRISCLVLIMFCFSQAANALAYEQAKERCGVSYKNFEPIGIDLVKVSNSTNFLFAQYGVIDKYCNVVIPVQYSNIKDYKSNILVESYGTYGLYDNYGRVIFPVEYDLIEVISSNFYQVQQGNYYAIVDKDGNIISNDYYAEVKELPNSLLQIASYTPDMNLLYGIMSKTGYIILEPKYKKINLVNIPYFGVTDTNGMKIFDIFGREMFLFNYKNLTHLYATYFRAQDYNKNWGVVDKNGKVFIDFEYDKIEKADDGYIKIKQDSKWGAVNALGKIVLPCEYGPLEINKKIKNLPADTAHTKAYQKELQEYNVLLAHYYYYTGEYLSSTYTLSEIKTRFANNETLNLVQNLTQLLNSLGYYITK